MTVSLIAAMSRDRLIGDERGLPWRLPADLRRFRSLTMGKPVVLGRKTMELIPPLPGREVVVLTRDPAYRRDGVRVAHSPDEALMVAASLGDEVMIAGGAEVYRLFLGRADRFYLTVVEGDFAGTVRFPPGRETWAVAERQRHPADERNPFAHTFYRLERADGGVELEQLLASSAGAGRPDGL